MPIGQKDPKRRPALRWAAFVFNLVVFGTAGFLIYTYALTSLPAGWDPRVPLQVSDPVTPLTGYRLNRALADDAACLAALASGAQAQSLPDAEDSPQCHIRPQVLLSGVGDAGLAPVNTRCQTALRLAMWERHGIQPAARTHLGAGVRRITHFSSYNCREIRSVEGPTGRMSTHATADAIDISGFVLEDGRRIVLQQDWTGAPDKAAFLRDVQQSACDWFRVVLGPEYNALHADHFHLQHTGWGLCR